ncbi:malate dehydrogenase (oxaloacetate-decarboxylating) [Carnobacterium iners]|uniref:Malate dehydrogenase (Oxaloacetate-decarboxylating) n=1 Tax=Carnobacterium iners TaxID=1073423 RepID=A0A1X7MRI9_9LACT|nr:malic enzyme-like NAD(P)-binding protein [Carnobacterium iners]SEL09386.1 malate dehydrogenase (oxaloacetate-decarboxylating) [Carnobacterium iners]SMH26583.1 malate dehydrogenase (oxaloacetate-decarboxylating) [Carnobacterium iners]
MDNNEESLALHEAKKGKISVESKVSIDTRKNLGLAYTPGVAEPCRKIAENPSDVYRYTSKGNLVAVITDGTAVLGLGDIGPEASMPVMEGKAILFKEFAGINAFPVCLDTKDSQKIIQTIKNISPTFGGINLEDISSPRCFEIEKRLDDLLPIPVFHDDQHGTAIVVTAGILNSLRLIGKKIGDLRVVLNGPGAAGTAIIYLLMQMGVKDIIVCDENGILADNRIIPLDPHKKNLMEKTNPRGIQGYLSEALKDADVFIGVSIGRIVSKEMIESMANDPIVFAMANPVPEIMYEDAKKAGVRIMGTGRSDSPNQINNVLVFPGIFKGALSVRASTINHEMKIAAAYAIADMVQDEELSEEYIIPDALNKAVVEKVAQYVAQAAKETGVNQI